MNYIIPGVILLGAIAVWLGIRYYLRKSNYDNFIRISASLLLAKEEVRRSRMYGSVVFQLESCPENMKRLYITSIKGVDDNISVRDTERLYFDLNRPEGSGNLLWSASVLVNEKAIQCYEGDKGLIYIDGILVFEEGSEKRFAAKLPVRMISR